jgi:hypothetical protein
MKKNVTLLFWGGYMLLASEVFSQSLVNDKVVSSTSDASANLQLPKANDLGAGRSCFKAPVETGVLVAHYDEDILTTRFLLPPSRKWTCDGCLQTFGQTSVSLSFTDDTVNDFSILFLVPIKKIKFL